MIYALTLILFSFNLAAKSLEPENYFSIKYVRNISEKLEHHERHLLFDFRLCVIKLSNTSLAHVKFFDHSSGLTPVYTSLTAINGCVSIKKTLIFNRLSNETIREQFFEFKFEDYKMNIQIPFTVDVCNLDIKDTLIKHPTSHSKQPTSFYPQGAKNFYLSKKSGTTVELDQISLWLIPASHIYPQFRFLVNEGLFVMQVTGKKESVDGATIYESKKNNLNIPGTPTAVHMSAELIDFKSSLCTNNRKSILTLSFFENEYSDAPQIGTVQLLEH